MTDPTTKQPNTVTQTIIDITDLLGSANVQKAIGLVFAGDAGLEWRTLRAKIAGLTVGGLFTLGIHALDAYRAKIGR